MVSIHVLRNHGYVLGCLSLHLVGGGRRSHSRCCVDDQDNGFQLRREGSGLTDKKQFSLTSLQEAVETPCVKGGKVMDFLKEEEGCIDNL